MIGKRWFVFTGVSLLALAVTPPVVKALDTDSDSVRHEQETTQVALVRWRNASFPVENFQAYTSPYGYRRSATGGYSTEMHRGLDMAAPEGSFIRNWWGGKVVEVSDDSGCGTSVVIQSGQWLHIYCHMQGYAGRDSRGNYINSGGIQLWEGQTVSTGARIGRVGMTGRTTGPHLHWGLKYANQWVNPSTVLRVMYAAQGPAQNISSQPQ